MNHLLLEKLERGEIISSYRESGNSMTPLIRHREPVTLAPVDPWKLEKGDIVLSKVRGHYYTHLVSAVDHVNKRIQIANNHGHVNGWTNYQHVYAICTHVSGQKRPKAQEKVMLERGKPGEHRWIRTSEGPTDCHGLRDQEVMRCFKCGVPVNHPIAQQSCIEGRPTGAL